MRWHVALMAMAFPASALAEVDPACADLPKPLDYDEQVQQDFQQNFFALATSLSPLHGAVPHAPGRGSIGADIAILPPLSCEQRYVLDWTKTEDTNKSPIVPKIVASYAFPSLWNVVVPYAGFVFLPPIPLGGTRTLLLGGEVGIGVMAHEHVDVGARFHTSMQRTYGDVATAFDPENEPAVEDVLVASTWGFDAQLSAPFAVRGQVITPYIAAGYVNASTFFLVGDNNYVANNLHPYSGFAFSVGLDLLLVDHLRLGGEFYGAPGGYSLPDPDAVSAEDASRYGHLYTGRFRIGYEFGGEKKGRKKKKGKASTG